MKLELDDDTKTFASFECCTCSVKIYMELTTKHSLQKSGRQFYCLNGHPLVLGPDEDRPK